MDSRERLAQELLKTQQTVSALARKPQLGNSSIEDGGAIDVHDEDGNTTAVIGKQFDGTTAVAILMDPEPPMPSEPTYIAGPGTLTAKWDGIFTDEGGDPDVMVTAPQTFSRVEVHCSTDPDYDAKTADTMVGTIESPRGGEVPITHLWHEDVYYLRLVTRTQSGARSEPSAAVAASPEMSVTAEHLEDAQVALQEAQAEFEAAAGNLASEILKASNDLEAAKGRLADAEGELLRAFGQISGASEAAAAAQSAADAAVAEAATAFQKAEEAEAGAAAATGAAGAAEAAADAAAGEARSALSAAQAASGDATAAQNAADAAKAAAATAKSQAEAAGTAAAAADAKAAQAAADAAQAIADAAKAQKAATDADAKAAAAAGAASTAQAAADKAIGDASTANQAAADAAGIAAGKGKVLVQSTAPGPEDRNAVTLWIDTTGGNNTPKRWTSGTTWTAVTDKKATDAATAAANAASAASTAQQKANDAHTLAGTAESNAQAAIASASAAQNTADGLPKVLHGTGGPAGVAPDGSIWWQHDKTLSGNVIAQWNRVAGAWKSTPIDSQAIANLDVGKLTAGSADIVELVAKKIAAGTAAFQTADIGNLFVTETSTLNDVVAQRIAAKVGAFIKLYAENIIAGEGGNLIPNGAGEKGDTSGWPGNTITWDPVEKPTGLPGSFRSAPGSGTVQSQYTYWTVEPDTEYLVEVWLKADKPNSRLYIELRDQDGVHGTRSFKVEGELYAGSAENSPYPVQNFPVPTEWTKYSAVAKTLPTSNRMRVSGVYFNHSNGSERGATVWIAGLSMRRRVTGTIVATNSITAPKIVGSEEMWTKVLGTHKIHADEADLGSFIANQGFITALQSKGIRIQDDEGNDVINLSGLPPHRLEIRNNKQETIASIDEEGGIVGANLAVDGDPEFGGRPLLGTTGTYFSPNDQVVDGILDIFPRGVVAYGIDSFANKSIPTSSEGEMALLELEFDVEAGRAYRVTTTPMSVIANGPGNVFFNMRRTTDGTRPTLKSSLVYRDTFHGMTETGGDRNIFNVGGSYYIMAGTPNTNRLLFSIGTDSTATAIRISDSSYSGSLRVVVEDIGPNVADTSVLRTDTLYNSVEVKPTPPPVKKNYTKTYTATGWRSYLPNGSTYAWMTDKMFQGLSPAGYGALSSNAVFPTMTGDLSGATITSVEAYFYFNHWYSGAGGTARIHVHADAGGVDSTRAAQTYAVQSTSWKAGSGRWVKLPSSFWDGFRTGTWRGVGLSAGALSQYGYANGASTKIRINYKK